MLMQTYKQNPVPEPQDLATEQFRKFFPLDGYVSEDGMQITYKIKGFHRNGTLWFKTAANIIRDNKLPLEVHSLSNILGVDYATTKLIITYKTH